MQALGSGLLFTADILEAVRPGVIAYEAGRYWEALHTLVPQIERVIRELAKLLGENVYRFQPGTGEIYWSSLKSMLDLVPARAILAKIRPDLADELKYLLTDSRGLNLRDDVAHGILPYEQGTDTRALLCLLILLTLSWPQFSASATEDPPPAS
jgi:lysyl-tRNA synthetase class 1